MRKLFIHVGPPKTGTSAVQFFFSKYAGTDVLYPRVGLWADGSHHNLVFNYFRDYRRPEMQRADARELLRLIGQAASAQAGNLLISSEALNGRDLHGFVGELLSYLPQEHEWKTEILFACREHIELAASLYNQNVKDAVGMERAVPDVHLARLGPALKYAPYLRRQLGLDLAVRAINYHPSKTFVPRFLALVGVKDEVAGTQQNVSLSVKGLVATLAVNRVAKSVAKRKDYFTAIQRMSRVYGPSQPIFSKEAAQQAERHFRIDREILLDEFGVNLAAPDADSGQYGQFFISRGDLDEIAAAVAEFGDEGAAIVSGASAFLGA